MSVEVLDLEQLVKDYAEEFLDGEQKKHADVKNPVIVWDRMIVLYGNIRCLFLFSTPPLFTPLSLSPPLPLFLSIPSLSISLYIHPFFLPYIPLLYYNTYCKYS